MQHYFHNNNKKIQSRSPVGVPHNFPTIFQTKAENKLDKTFWWIYKFNWGGVKPSKAWLKITKTKHLSTSDSLTDQILTSSFSTVASFTSRMSSWTSKLNNGPVKLKIYLQSKKEMTAVIKKNSSLIKTWQKYVSKTKQKTKMFGSRSWILILFLFW